MIWVYLITPQTVLFGICIAQSPACRSWSFLLEYVELVLRERFRFAVFVCNFEYARQSTTDNGVWHVKMFLDNANETAICRCACAGECVSVVNKTQIFGGKHAIAGRINATSLSFPIN